MAGKDNEHSFDTQDISNVSRSAIDLAASHNFETTSCTSGGATIITTTITTTYPEGCTSATTAEELLATMVVPEASRSLEPHNSLEVLHRHHPIGA